MKRSSNPPTFEVVLTFSMYQAAKKIGKFEFGDGERGDSPEDGIVFYGGKEEVTVEGYPDDFLNLVQVYIDLLDRRKAEGASWAAIHRISAAAMEWHNS